MKLLPYIGILAATYSIYVLGSLILFWEPRWGICFALLLFSEFARVFTIWFNFLLRGR